jgi:hypothetical protein
MLKSVPGVFVAGEMVDWEAPTGGYLLTACFAGGGCRTRCAAMAGGAPAGTLPAHVAGTVAVHVRWSGRPSTGYRRCRAASGRRCGANTRWCLSRAGSPSPCRRQMARIQIAGAGHFGIQILQLPDALIWPEPTISSVHVLAAAGIDDSDCRCHGCRPSAR